MTHTLDPRDAFINQLIAYQSLEAPAAAHLYELVRLREFSRKESLLLPGQVNNCLYFVYSGLVRGYHLQPN
jgi:CRP-like cAMP-binding protein